MKGLLDSKRFRTNLYKWLFMYVVTMGLLTTVITYSKYISSMLDQKEETRVTKFNVNLKYCADAECTKSGVGIYDADKFRPTGEMIYYFAVDSSELEVAANLILTISVDRHFVIENIEKMVNGKQQMVTSISKSDNDGKTISIENKILPTDDKITKYKVTVKYDERVADYNNPDCTDATTPGCQLINGVIRDENGLPYYIFNENDIYEILKIGYSATQER